MPEAAADVAEGVGVGEPRNVVPEVEGQRQRQVVAAREGGREGGREGERERERKIRTNIMRVPLSFVPPPGMGKKSERNVMTTLSRRPDGSKSPLHSGLAGCPNPAVLPTKHSKIRTSA